MDFRKILLRLKTRQDLLFNTYYFQVMVELTNSVVFSSMAGLSRTLSDRGLWRWPTRECGPVTSVASSESPMDVSRRFFQGTIKPKSNQQYNVSILCGAIFLS